MAVTRLERKGQRNKAKAKARVNRIKLLSKRPTLKNVDVEAIKAEWAKKGAKPEKAEKAETVEAVADAAPAEEKPKKKAPAKKKAESTEE